MLFNKFFNKRQSGDEDEDSKSTDDELIEQLTDQAKQQAYKKILLQSRFGELDGLNEYDENYSHFIPRGDLLTAEMRNALERLDSLKKDYQQTEDLSVSQVNDDSGKDQA